MSRPSVQAAQIRARRMTGARGAVHLGQRQTDASRLQAVARPHPPSALRGPVSRSANGRSPGLPRSAAEGRTIR